ncbi:helix-turn-helix domain-containing protein [Chromobacterium haemolyticum]|nr:helix-turn-helix domain-containing protein [Chromobacterium haemolyticum]
MSPFAHMLHELRMRYGIRQGDLAELIGYEQSYVSSLEVGIKGPPQPEFITKLIKALDLPPEDQARLSAAVTHRSASWLSTRMHHKRCISWLPTCSKACPSYNPRRFE